jgi:hypothetical protein
MLARPTVAARRHATPAEGIGPATRTWCAVVAAAGFAALIVGCSPDSGKGSDSPSSSASATGGGPSATATSPNAIQKTVAPKTLATAKPVAIDQTATFGNRVAVRISALKSFNATAHGVGEISGPAVAVTFVIKNDAARSIDLGSVTANLQDAAGTPSTSMVGSPAKPFAGRLAAGGSSTGTYVFALPKSHHNPVTISFSYTTEAPIVVFVGNA